MPGKNRNQEEELYDLTNDDTYAIKMPEKERNQEEELYRLTNVDTYAKIDQRQKEIRFIKQNIKIPKPLDSSRKIDQVRGGNIGLLGNECEKVPTNAFGEIEFTDQLDTPSKYVRLDVDTEVEKIRDLLDNCWGLQKPELILSVTGGAKNFWLSKKLTEAFKRGLYKISMHTSTWIVTAGTNYGVAKFTGRAVRDCRLARSKTKSLIKPLYAIGIATWGCVQSKEILESKTENGNYPAKYSPKGEIKKRKRILEPYHSHFLLVDYSGSEYLPDKEIQFRANVEEEMMKPRHHSDTAEKKVPIVQIVIEGGVSALQTTLKALEKGTPVLLVEGSGRIADILVFAVKNGDALKNEEMKLQSGNSPIVDILKKKLKDQLPEKDEEETYKYVLDCLNYRKLIKYFDGNKILNDIDFNILDAILLEIVEIPYTSIDVAVEYKPVEYRHNTLIIKIERFSWTQTFTGFDKAHDHNTWLKLAVTWDRIDVVRQKTDSRTLQKLDKNIMSSAVCLNRPRFVEFLLENGINPKEFADSSLLEDVFITSNCEPICNQWKKWEDVSKTLKDILHGEYAVPKYLLHLIEQEKYSGEEPKADDACQILFILCLLLNRKELAKVFWKRGRNGISSALIAYGLLNGLATETDDEEEKKLLEQNAEEFNSIAIDVLKLCYDKSEKITTETLERKQSDWGGALDNIDIAYTTQNKAFIATSACQTVFLNRWMGKIHNQTSTFMLILSVIFPWFLFCIEYKKQNDDSNDKCFSNSPENQKNIQKDKQKTKGPTSRMKYNCLEKVYHFYTSPFVVAALNMISYVIFLALFAYVLLAESETYVTQIDILLMVWVFCMTVEEIRQCLTQKLKNFKDRLFIYLRSDYNKIDILTILMFSCGMTLRFSPLPYAFSAGRTILGLSFLIYSMRILHIFTVNKQLGPWLVMIRRMTVDLVYFFLILVVFVVSYAISAHSIAFPNSKLDWTLVYSVLRTAYWNIYGELFLEEIEVEEPKCSFNVTIFTSDLDIPQCPTVMGRYIVPILRGVYVMFSNILLLNLLISIFCNTYQSVQNKANIYWSFERYEMIREYKTRPCLPAPLVLLRHFSMLIVWFFKWFSKLCLRKDLHRDNKKCQQCGKDCPTKHQKHNERNLIRWEKVAMMEYLEQKEKEQNECIDRNNEDRVEELKEKMGAIQTAQKLNEEMVKQLIELMKHKQQDR